MNKVLVAQKKSQIITKYLESIAQYKIDAKKSGNTLSIRVGSSSFNLDTSKNKTVNSRQVLNR